MATTIESLAQQIYEILEKYEKQSQEDLDFTDYITVDDIIDIIKEYGNVDKIIEEIDEHFNNSEIFYREVIRYSNAIEYLKEYDPSLMESAEEAFYCGYDIKNISSEILASLLKSKKSKDEYYELWENIKSEIEDLDFDDLEEEDENDEE